MSATQRPRERDAPSPPAWEPEQWIDEGVVGEDAPTPRRSADAPTETPSHSSGRVVADGRNVHRPKHLQSVSPRAQPQARSQTSRDARLTERIEEGLKSAGEDFRHERFEDARRTLRRLAERAPDVAAVRELYGLTLYRLGRWKLAARELEAFRSLTGSVDQHPVLADCYRALRRYDRVRELWRELRSKSPAAALVTEGRIVVAGTLADQGQLGDAIAFLSRGVRPVRRPKEHHLRAMYALADLYERAGDLPRARELFQRVAERDPAFVDVDIRLRALK